jgi:transcriptional regulator of acetoin/glycerol metabolism
MLHEAPTGGVGAAPRPRLLRDAHCCDATDCLDARYRSEGQAGLRDRSSCPAHNPRHLSASAERRILGVRRRRKLGPHRLAALLGMPRSTCYAVLRRHGL